MAVDTCGEMDWEAPEGKRQQTPVYFYRVHFSYTGVLREILSFIVLPTLPSPSSTAFLKFRILNKCLAASIK